MQGPIQLPIQRNHKREENYRTHEGKSLRENTVIHLGRMNAS